MKINSSQFFGFANLSTKKPPDLLLFRKFVRRMKVSKHKTVYSPIFQKAASLTIYLKTYHSGVFGLDERPVDLVDIEVEAARVAEVPAFGIASPQRRRGRSAVCANSAI